ncbi:ATP-binding protein [Undibacterium sp.]|uniref:ATP-binding protein n=1 Tax=Undibacterium sp. TaxID=1914977 RepID=UPI0025EE7A4E|nr:ATP-binding protein [Undibacterium sp.]
MPDSRTVRRLDADHILLGFFCLIVVVVLAQFWWNVSQDKQQTLASERANGLVAARILEEHAAQTMQDGVQMLDTVANALSSKALDDAGIRQVLQAYTQQDSRFIKALQYIDLSGSSYISSVDYPTHQVQVKERKHVQFLLSHPEHTQAVLGRPYQSSYDSQLVLPLARNMYDAQHMQIGIISTDIRLAYFANVYAKVAKQSNAMLSLIADEGYVIVRSPFEARYVDRDISAYPVMQRLGQMPEEGDFEDDSLLDDEFSRLYTYHKVQGFPLTMLYGRDFDSILVYYHLRLERRALFTASVLLLFCLMSWILRSQIRKLRISEASLRNTQLKFSEIFQRSPVALSLVSLQHRRIDARNDACLDLFGYPRHSGSTSSMQIDAALWVDAEQRKLFRTQLSLHGSVDLFEAELRRIDGLRMVCLLSARIYDAGHGAEQMFIMSIQDISHQREIEQQMQELNAQLEQRVAARTLSLAQSNTELEDALASLKKMQSELIRSEKLASLGSLVAGIAHELNTPIGNSVTLASTMQYETQRLQGEVSNGKLRRGSFDHFLEQMAFGTDILLRSLSRAADLIRSFKHVAVDQSSDMRRNFDLQLVLSEVILANASLYQKTPFQMETTLEPGIMMDSFPGALGQVMTNLIANAIAHGFEGLSHGSMRLTAARTLGDMVTLDFADNGVGISEANLKKVFDPFFTTKLGQGGSGLGMNIVYNLVTEVLGGSIDISSELEHGTRIHIVLPLMAPQAAPSINSALTN